MKKSASPAFREMRREVARFPAPAAVLDEKKRILFRNRKAALLFPRLRALDRFLAEEREKEAALLVRPVAGSQALLWLSPPRDGFRKLALLRRFSAEEAKTVLRLMEDGDDATREEKREPVELCAVLADGGGYTSGGIDPDKSELWTAPDSRALISRVGRFLHILCGNDAVTMELTRKKKQALLHFTIPDRTGITREILGLVLANDGQAPKEAESAPQSTVLTVGESRYKLILRRAEGACVLTLALPVESRIASSFFQGKQRRKKGEKTVRKSET